MEKSDIITERHPLQPFLPQNARILMLGSFPPSHKRWSMEFFYPNYINDMWRIFGIVLYDDKLHFVDEAHKTFRIADIIAMLRSRGIAIYDTACAIRRTTGTASDKDLEIVERTDIDALLRKIPQCHAIVTTGQKASEVVAEHFGIDIPKVGHHSSFAFEGRDMKFWRMPSSSRAYPMNIQSKATHYRALFSAEGLIGK